MQAVLPVTKRNESLTLYETSKRSGSSIVEFIAVTLAFPVSAPLAAFTEVDGQLTGVVVLVQGPWDTAAGEQLACEQPSGTLGEQSDYPL